MSDYPPSVQLCKLYERTSRKGNTYLAGRLGAAKVVILKSADTSDDGAPIWNVLVSEAPQTAKPEAANAEPRPVRERPPTPRATDLDGEIPF